MAKWIPDAKPDWWSTAETFLSNPQQSVKKILFGTLLGGIAWLVSPIFDAIRLIFVGSDPTTLGGAGESWGIADVPVILAGFLGDAVAIPIKALLGVASGVIEAVTVSTPGAFDAAIVMVVVGALFYVVARYGPVVVQAGLEAIPVIGGPLSTLLGGIR